MDPLELLSVTPLNVDRSSLIFRKDIGHGKLAGGWLRVETTSSLIWYSERKGEGGLGEMTGPIRGFIAKGGRC